MFDGEQAIKDASTSYPPEKLKNRNRVQVEFFKSCGRLNTELRHKQNFNKTELRHNAKTLYPLSNQIPSTNTIASHTDMCEDVI